MGIGPEKERFDISNVKGYGCCNICGMFPEELQKKMRQLEFDLSERRKQYTEAIKSHRNYNSLRSIREEIRKIESELINLRSEPQSFK
jgi:hypothetical protein